MLPILLNFFVGMFKRECLLMLKAERRWAGRDNLSNPQGDVVRRKVKLRDFHNSVIQSSEGSSVEGVLSSEWLVAMSA